MRNIVLWVLRVLLAVAFLGAGSTKLTGQPMMVHEFKAFGLPVWFMYLTGIVEVTSAVLVLVPRFAFIGAGLLVCTMIGALLAHLAHGQAGMIGARLVLLALAIAVGSLRGWGRTSRTRFKTRDMRGAGSVFLDQVRIVGQVCSLRRV